MTFRIYLSATDSFVVLPLLLSICFLRFCNDTVHAMLSYATFFELMNIWESPQCAQIQFLAVKLFWEICVDSATEMG